MILEESNAMPMARGLFSLLLAALLLCSCSSIRFVPLERVRTDSTYLTRVRHDSVTASTSTRRVTR